MVLLAFCPAGRKSTEAEGVKGGGFAPCILPLTPEATMENPAGQKKVDSLRTCRSQPLGGEATGEINTA
jgi:hypothetical protein